MIHPAVREMATPVGVLRIYLLGDKPARLTLGEVGRPPVPCLLRPPRLVSEMEDALAVYFAGGAIDRALSLRLLGLFHPTPFQEAVYRRVIAIPRGETLSYREVAESAGHAGAARAVGNALRDNPFPIFIPCHRVIRADGGLGGFGGREDIKAMLLAHEGIEVDRDLVRA
ncbi:MAG: MGMT family protein [Actinomycetota bacterium]|nr:MGMT family protein [Actinomycetota bacterium]